MRTINFLFFKYQSLGNDFILFDWTEKTEEQVDFILTDPAWHPYVIALADRHTGVGADGVLVLFRQKNDFYVRIFNADGSEAETCLNGLRAVARHLYDAEVVKEAFSIYLGKNSVDFVINKDAPLEVTTIITHASCQGGHELVFSQGKLAGYKAQVGNPHFLVFEKKERMWLDVHGKELESHSDFPAKANISFIWRDEQIEHTYHMMTYERGCGITQACSSAATVALKTLYYRSPEIVNKSLTIKMLGGEVQGSVDERGNVILIAPALRVFTGVIGDL